MIARSDIVAAARSWVGTPYHHQASLKGTGCDCLGLIRGVWRELNGPEPEAMPAYTKDWNEAQGAEELLAAAERHLLRVARPEAAAIGDVVVFRIRTPGPAKHAGIICALPASGPLEREGPRMVHAQEGVGVVEVSLSSWWRRRIVAAFRFPGVEETP